MTTTFITALPVSASVGGGKAASLAVLASCGLAVPDGFVCTDRLFRYWVQQALGAEPVETEEALERFRTFITDSAFPEGFAESLDEALRALGCDRFAVRSSFALEDDADALAAGVFESVVNVAIHEVLQAVRQVLLSAVSPAAQVYVRARKRQVLTGPMGVLVHGYVAGSAEGHVAASTAGAFLWVRNGQLSEELKVVLEHSASNVAKLHGSSELEWVCARDRLAFLQWRPYAPAPPAVPWRPSENDQCQSVSAPNADWIWDSAHNPAPLSPAHQGLVSLVNDRCNVGYDQKVVGGYLFYRKNAARSPMRLAAGDVDEFFVQLQSQVLADLAGLSHPPELQAALAVFVRHYEALVGVLGGAVRSGKKGLSAFVEEHAPKVLPQVAAFLAHQPSKATERAEAFARVTGPSVENADAAWTQYLDVFGDEPAAWDVMSPTQRELPRPKGALPAAAKRTDADDVARQTIVQTVEPQLRAQCETLIGMAARCSARGEDDDWLYARLQAPVRFALEAVGRTLALQGALDHESDVFFLPLDCVLQLAAIPATSALPLREWVGKAKALFAQQVANPPPVAGGASLSQLRGHGTFGRVVGKVKFYKAGQRFTDNTSILVATSLLPTELPLISAAGFVAQFGGPLDHVAAQARERNVPAVVGVANATTLLCEGDLVLVDADAGAVVRLQRAGE